MNQVIIVRPPDYALRDYTGDEFTTDEAIYFNVFGTELTKHSLLENFPNR